MTRAGFAMVVALAAFGGAARAAHAAPATAQQIPIQGVARDTSGIDVATGSVAVRIYADSTGGSPVYDSSGEFASAISQGVFDVVVGGATPLMLDDERAYFLELDAGGAPVIGPASGGRWKLFPGGGSHARGDLEARLTSLEQAMGLGPQMLQARGAHATANPTRLVASSARATTSNSSKYTILGSGRFAGSSASYSALGTMLLQPIGVRTAGAIRALLGPYDLPVPPIGTGVDDRVTPPARFSLHPARPNPFRSRAELAFDLPSPALVRLAIYDVQGRCVRTLMNEERGAGTQRVAWNGRSDAGDHLNAGVYRYRLQAGVWSASGRLVLLP